jgi:hypothetical protein
MTICAVIDITTKECIALIVAEPNDPPFDGTFLVELPEGTYWDGEKVSPNPLPDITE